MKKIIKEPQQELPFEPVDSKITLDLSPEKFKHSDEFSKMMDRANRAAMQDKIGFRVISNLARQR